MATRSRAGVTRACVRRCCWCSPPAARATSTRRLGGAARRPAAAHPRHRGPRRPGDPAADRRHPVRAPGVPRAGDAAGGRRSRTARPVLERWTARSRRSRSPAHRRPRTSGSSARPMQRWSLITGRHLTLTTGPADVDDPLRAPCRVRRGARRRPRGPDRGRAHPRLVRARPPRRRSPAGSSSIASDDDQVTRNRTIAHELGHAMGLQHSTCPSSLMDGSSDGERSVRWSPSALDIRMGSLLYDPRLDARARPDRRRGDPHADRGRRRHLRTGRPRADPGRRHRAPLLLRPVAGPGPARARATSRTEPTLPLVNPDAWTDGSHAQRRSAGLSRLGPAGPGPESGSRVSPTAIGVLPWAP